MVRIAHLSDLHFGTEDAVVAAALARDVIAFAPDLVVVSGDLTQRARLREFRAARCFLDRLPFPRVVVPGNHDLPLFDLAERILRPLARFRREIEADPMPSWNDDQIAVAGLATPRRSEWKGGRVSRAQLGRLRQRFTAFTSRHLRVLVTHHEFVPPPGSTGNVVGRAAPTMIALSQMGVDLLLAGHRHRGYSAESGELYPLADRSLVVVQAGTATSWRRRGEANGWNLIDAHAQRMAVTTRTWTGAGFINGTTTSFARIEGGWGRDG